MRLNFPRMGPWETRPLPDGAQDLPASDACARTWDGKLVLSIRDNPLRTGHVWLPPSTLTLTYGVARARMRFPGGRGFHSCFWLQDVVPYETPEAHEVDIAEHFGAPKIHQTVHWVDEGKRQNHHAVLVDPKQWHVYEVNVGSTG